MTNAPFWFAFTILNKYTTTESIIHIPGKRQSHPFNIDSSPFHRWCSRLQELPPDLGDPVHVRIEFFCWAGLPIVVSARLSVWGKAMRERLHLGLTGSHCLHVSRSM